MTRQDQLLALLDIRSLRVTAAQRRMQEAQSIEIQRQTVAQAAQERQHAAVRTAQEYMYDRFKDAANNTNPAAFFKCLALGQRFANREAETLAVRAERLAQRHRSATSDRSDAVLAYVAAQSRADHFADVIDNMMAVSRANDEAADEEDIQDILAGGQGHEPA
ncbi:hypothetical protein [Yoonia sp. 2307UL14-13]|uniref:hypothetical protein n=1 Tax=Yoonia sp. 2307UL14-13 TaxID=3126506 RepID=UPI00309C96C3